MSQPLKLLDLTDDALSHVVRCVLPPSEDFEMADNVKALPAFRASCKRIWNLTNNAMDNYWRDLCHAGWAFKQRPCKGVTLYHLYGNDPAFALRSPLEHYTWKETFELSMRYLTPYVGEEYRREKVHLHCAMDQIRTLGWDWKLQIADSLRDALHAASKLRFAPVEAVMNQLLTGLVPQEHGADVVERIRSLSKGGEVLAWAGDARLKEISNMLVGSDERQAALDEVPDLLKGGAHFTYEEKRPPTPNVLELAVVEKDAELAELACQLLTSHHAWHLTELEYERHDAAFETMFEETPSYLELAVHHRSWRIFKAVFAIHDHLELEPDETFYDAIRANEPLMVRALLNSADYWRCDETDLTKRRDYQMDSDETTPVVAAVQSGSFDMLRIILKGSDHADFSDHCGRYNSILHEAVARNHTDMVREILEHYTGSLGCDYDETMVAALGHRNADVVEMLVKSDIHLDFDHEVCVGPATEDRPWSIFKYAAHMLGDDTRSMLYAHCGMPAPRRRRGGLERLGCDALVDGDSDEDWEGSALYAEASWDGQADGDSDEDNPVRDYYD